MYISVELGFYADFNVLEIYKWVFSERLRQKDLFDVKLEKIVQYNSPIYIFGITMFNL